MKARKKPVVIDFIYVEIGYKNLDEIIEFVGQKNLMPIERRPDYVLQIKTLEGNHNVSYGDIIIKVNKVEVLDDLRHSNFRIRGVQLLIGYVDMYASVKLNLSVSISSGSKVQSEVIGRSDTVGKTIISPLLQFRSMMTRRLDWAVFDACKDSIEDIAKRLKTENAERRIRNAT